tara:strand:- start:4713 stop:5585 length:873 start_codon:yes stop_codon:yes gene_type:complete
MIQKVLFKIIFIIFLFSAINAELLKPSIGGEKKEILIISDKRRVYTVLDNDSLVYDVYGPARLELISRYPVNNKTKKSQKFSYTLFIDNEKPIMINHRYKIQRSIRSVQHPNHYFTYSGNYFFNISEGNHRIILKPSEEKKYPVLLRMLKKDFDKVAKNRNELTPMVFQSNYKVMVEGKPVSYYQLSKNRPLQLDIDGSKKLRILSRLVFDEYMGSNETYRLRVKNGKKVLGTYFLSSERSSTSYIVDIKDKVPGKWRTCEIDIPAGKQIITVEIVENNKNVLTRFQEYK